MAINTETWVVTPERATQILKDHHYANQRPIRVMTVKKYAADMQDGAWNDGTHLTFCVLNHHLILIDGYHRLSALIKAQYTATFTVSFIPVTSMSEIAQYWAQIDSGRRRTPNDMIAVFDYQSITDLPKLWISATQAAASFLVGGGRNAREASRRVVVTRDATLLYLPYTEMYYAALSRKPYTQNDTGKSFIRRSVLAVALLSYRYAAPIDKAKVDGFWECIWGDGLLVGDPRKLAYEQIKFVGVTGSNARPDVVAPEDDFRYLATCFNLWWDGQSRRRKLSHLPVDFVMRCVPAADQWAV